MTIELRLRLERREPFAAGESFGDVGPYERLTGRVHFAVHPSHPAYREVIDLEYAPRNAAGLVEYSTALDVLKPLEPHRGNRRLLYDVVNRGNKRLLQFFNDAPPSQDPSQLEDAGNGFLMRQGYSIVWSAWQGDLLPGDGRMTMELPSAALPEGDITGAVRAECIVEAAGLRCLPLSGNTYTRSYESVSLDPGTAQFTCRAYEREARQPIPATAWQFARLDAAQTPVPSATHCYVPEGLRPGWIYELIYMARRPLVLGLGFTGLRDLISFLRYAEHDADGMPNPLGAAAGRIEKAYAWGRSQSGRFLREFVYRGWNQEAQGRRVFDGIMPHVTGGGRVTLNYRFAQPGRYPRQHEEHLYPSDQFPFAYRMATDPHTGRTDALLRRPATDPLIMHTQTSSEYWQRRGSLVHTDAFGVDLPEHPQARLYFLAGSQHFAAPHGTPQRGRHQHLSNPLDTAPLLRALLHALDQWVTCGVQPPASRIPRRADGTLVNAEAVQTHFPALPHVVCPEAPNRLYVQEYGPEVVRGRFTQEPPQVDLRREYAVLVPAIDADGNEIAGLRTPHVQVPLGTFTGWNFRPGEQAKAMASIIGSYFPFARTAAERQASGDPRPAIAERYRCRADYVRQIAVATQALLDTRLLLPEDADRYVRQAMHEPIVDPELLP